MMRILHVVTLVDDQASYGGAFTVAVNQCQELRHRGHDARIVGGWLGTRVAPTQVEGVPVHLFRVRPVAPGLGFSALFSAGLLRWVHDHAASFDVAHLHLARDLVPLSVAEVLRRADLPYVVQTHGALGPDFRLASRIMDQTLTQRTLLGAQQVFVLTPEERDAVSRVSGTAQGISLLPHGIVLPDRVPATITEGPADVLFLGRLHPDRRVLAFAAAAERLVADGVDASFAVAGPDGGDLKALRRFIAARPALRGRLRYEGVLPHGRAVERLRRASIYVFPSIDDQSSPMSLLEALAAGVPTIATTRCPVAGTLAREGAAIVANPTDDALYGAMRRLLTDRPGRARLSARAAATAASAFSMTAVAEILEEQYGADSTRSRSRSVSPRQTMLWVTPRATAAHVEVWDAMRTGTDLTVVLLEPTEPQSPSAEDVVGRPELTGRGYPVVRVTETGDGAPGVLRSMIRARPEVMVLDGDRPGAYEVLTRWAQRSGVTVVTASEETGPGAAAARAWLVPGRPTTIDLDLRTPRSRPGPRPGAGDGQSAWPTPHGRHDLTSFRLPQTGRSGLPPRPSRIIDLQAGTGSLRTTRGG